MNKTKIRISFLILILMPLIILVISFLYPSEFRKEELAREKEINITNKFISGQALTDEEISYLKQRNFKYFLPMIQCVYYKDKGKAYRLYTEAVRMGLESQHVYGTMADLYESRNEIDKAIILYEKAVKLDPDVKLWTTKSYIKKVADLYYSIADYYNASIYYEEYLKFFNRSVYDIYRLASCYVNLERLDEAIARLNSAIDINPGNAHLTNIYNLLGIVYEKKGMLEEAVKNYTQSLRINPKNEEAKANLERVKKKLTEQKI